jgi:hypothetical protein
VAQYKRGRISFPLMADIAQKRGWINCAANQFAITMTRYLTEYTATGFPIAIA